MISPAAAPASAIDGTGLITGGQTALTADGEPCAEPAAETTAESTGEPAAEQATAPDKGGENPNTALYVIIALLSLLLAGVLAGGAFYIIKNRKGYAHHEKTSDISADAGVDGGVGDARSGG